MTSDGLAGKTEAFFRVGVTPRLELGFGYLAKQQTLRPLANYTFLTETAKRPALTGGLMFDSLGGGRQGVFASVARNLAPSLGGVPLSAYIGTALITREKKPRLIAGANLRMGRDANASVQFDGRYANVGLTTSLGSVGGVPVRFGIVAAKGDRFGPLLATSLPLGDR